MSRLSLALASVLLTGAAVFAIPGSPAGSATSCVAWAALPRHVALSGTRPAHVRVTLQATPACAGVTFDNGATAVLRGPGSVASRFPLRFSHIGASYSVTLYAGINAPGTYRVSGGNLQTYDAYSFHIPFSWRATSMSVTG